MLGMILMMFAFVFAVIAALFVERVSRGLVAVHFGWLAVAFWLLSILIGSSFR